MKKLIIFDFDGTTVDTITDVAICFNKALQINEFPQHPLEKFNGFVGGNLETVVSRMLPQGQVTSENINKVKTVYRKLYLESSKPNTKPYVGIMELMSRLKYNGFLLAVNSNKGQLLLDDMVEKLFPPNFFVSVIGYSEKRPSKPDPYGVDLICSTCDCDRTDAIYVGDGKSDIDTADNAGIPCVFVKWGQGTEADLQDPRVCVVVETAEQLEQALMKIAN